ncbi:uncharacterized protein LOC132564408 [Ylistrum balloti]|uniref:uncharacterized protein LOC132564408 n=1 Tax=Ylistrum balloti TaxID=509963 RepID=UPI002905A97F|nr:uncharacterized protein LOC132564408 [Ylistrum balloti]
MIFIPGADQQLDIPKVTNYRSSHKKSKTSKKASKKTSKTVRLPPKKTKSSTKPKATAKSTWSGGDAPRLIWPLDGTITSGFGKRNGVPHDGIDVAAPIGTEIVAAAAGRVVYSDNKLSGYGNLIIIRHKDTTEQQYSCCFRGIDLDYDESYPIQEIIYRGKESGALLEVSHDRKIWAANHSAQAWKQIFESRWGSVQHPYSSGVWGKKEWVLPEIETKNIVTLGEGKTHLMPISRLGDSVGVPEVYIKMCGNTHTGSFKDLGMTVLVSMVNQLRYDGMNIPAMICASTGDTSAALAAYGSVAAIPTIVMLPRGKVSTAQLVQPLANGATVLSLDTDFDGCMALVQELTAKYNLYLANSMNSLRIEGQKTVAYDIVQQLNWEVPDWVIIPGGNLGNVSALAKGFEDLESVGLITKRPRIACAQAKAASPLYHSYQNNWSNLQALQAQPTQASAIRIGNPVSFNKAIKALIAFNGVVASVSEQELAEATANADRLGTYSCPHTGVAIGAFYQLAKTGVIQAKDSVVIISTAHGLKFTEFKVGYHENTLADIQSLTANKPIEVAAKPTVVWDAIQRSLETKTNKN